MKKSTVVGIEADGKETVLGTFSQGVMWENNGFLVDVASRERILVQLVGGKICSYAQWRDAVNPARVQPQFDRIHVFAA